MRLFIDATEDDWSLINFLRRPNSKQGERKRFERIAKLQNMYYTWVCRLIWRKFTYHKCIRRFVQNLCVFFRSLTDVETMLYFVVSVWITVQDACFVVSSSSSLISHNISCLGFSLSVHSSGVWFLRRKDGIWGVIFFSAVSRFFSRLAITYMAMVARAIGIRYRLLQNLE